MWISVSDYKYIAGISDTSEDLKLALVIPMCQAAIESALDRNVESASYTEIISDSFGLQVKNLPVTAIDTITFDFGGPNEVEIDGDEFWVDDIGRIYLNSDSTASPVGGVVQVEYTGGYATVPPLYVMALLTVLNTVMTQTDNEAIITEKSFADVKIKYANAVWTAVGEPVVQQALQILAGERIPGIG